jgi:translocation protein SEC63
MTLTSLVTLPLTYSLLKPSKDADALAPRTKTDYTSEHSDVINDLRNAQKRKLRKVKRLIFVVVGWGIIAAMVYLILVTQTITPKIWNPYDILGISDVRFPQHPILGWLIQSRWWDYGSPQSIGQRVADC